MPYLASLTDWIVRPSDFEIEFDRDDDLECPHCEREMVFKKCDGRADHFAHTPDSVNQSSNTGGGGGVGGCEHAGESETHELMKKKAITQLRKDFPPFESITLEKRLESMDNDTKERRVDVVGTFEESHPEYGEGVCVEVQYRNDSKDFLQTVWDYTENEYSVCWVFYDNWEKMFEVKNELRTSIMNPVYFGHIEEIDESIDLGKPITPYDVETFPTELLEKYGGRGLDMPYLDDSGEGWEDPINTLASCIAARECGEIHPAVNPAPAAFDVIHEFFTPLDINPSIREHADDQELRMLIEIFQELDLDDISQMFRHSAVLRKYGISKSDLTVFSVGTKPRKLERKLCDVCKIKNPDCQRWQWANDSGASPFQICSDCRDQLDENTTTCPLCDSDEKTARSDGFGPIGAPDEIAWYDGCDWCREKVLFTDEPVRRFTLGPL